MKNMSKSILITDDALFMRTTLRNILVSNGYTIAAEAGNGKEAVEKYRSSKPNLVLLDITMPVMDGIAAAREIKSIDPNANIVMCTAMGQKDMVMEAIKAGAKDFIVKPFQPDRVIDSIQKLIGAA
jgi:two-component system, chemotaxis family, chemotaxis protein CheY